MNLISFDFRTGAPDPAVDLLQAQPPPNNAAETTRLLAGGRLKAASQIGIYAYVYLLIKDGATVYVGQTSDLSGRVSQHRSSGKVFDEVRAAQVPIQLVSHYERALIHYLRPPLNSEGVTAPYTAQDQAIIYGLETPGSVPLDRTDMLLRHLISRYAGKHLTDEGLRVYAAELARARGLTHEALARELGQAHATRIGEALSPNHDRKFTPRRLADLKAMVGHLTGRPVRTMHHV